MSLNINMNTDDMSYRYKMDKVAIALTGSGKNSHTNITNITSIADQLNTNMYIIMSYIGWSLGTNITDNIVKGHYNNDVIQNIIFNFIKFATLCNKCTIPELTPIIKGKNKNKELHMECSACGSSYILEGDNKINNKLVDTMIKYYSINEFKPKDGNIVKQ